jgi:hypothetical protein
MSRPSKPFEVLTTENRSHRTKAEIEQRKQGEEALASGTALKERSEVKLNGTAHNEFTRINKLLKKIQKNDALYEPIINRYCMILSECYDMSEKRDGIYETAIRLEQKFEELGAGASFNELRAVTNDIACIYGTMLALDKQLDIKRKMLLDIEKENIMTIASALRSIPKKVDKPEEEDPMSKILNRQRRG